MDGRWFLIEEKVIIELTTDYHPLFLRMARFYDAINAALSESQVQDFYLEPIYNGVLYIFQNFDTFKRIHRPMRFFPEFLKKRVFKISDQDKREILGDTLKNESNFPQNGINYFIHSQTLNKNSLFLVLEGFYRSLHPDIETIQEADQIIIHFKTYNSIMRSFELNVWAANKGLSGKKIALADLIEENASDKKLE